SAGQARGSTARDSDWNRPSRSGAVFRIHQENPQRDQGRRAQAVGGRPKVEEPMKAPRLTDQAKDDLRDIWYSTSSKRDERAADQLVLQILDKCHSHAQFPESGRLREEISPGLRSFPIRPYVVF